jgi:hypothetical protein
VERHVKHDSNGFNLAAARDDVGQVFHPTMLVSSPTTMDQWQASAFQCESASIIARRSAQKFILIQNIFRT